MDFQEVLERRFSCRSFEEKEIEPEKLDAILRAAQYGPSGMNRRPYRFVVCLSKEARDKVYDALPFGRYNVPVAILVVGDKKKSPDLWYEDCAASAENILLAATNLGIGSLWCAAHPFTDRLRNLNIIAEANEDEAVFCAILLGYAKEDAKRRPKTFEEEKVKRI